MKLGLTLATLLITTQSFAFGTASGEDSMMSTDESFVNTKISSENTAFSSEMSHVQKVIILAAKEDAAYAIATDFQIVTARLINGIKAARPLVAKEMTDIEIVALIAAQ